jgi:hypothetical protein
VILAERVGWIYSRLPPREVQPFSEGQQCAGSINAAAFAFLRCTLCELFGKFAMLNCRSILEALRLAAMKKYSLFFGINSLFVLLIISLTVFYVLVFDNSARILFEPPAIPESPAERLFTYIFQLLCSVPTIVCVFSWGLLRIWQPGSKYNKFILYSALITAGFWINEIFRIHIILLGSAGIPKLVTVLVYAIAAFAYGFAFRHTIRSTPYFLLIVGAILLGFGIFIDSLHLNRNGTASFLEGIPKLFSQLNITIYFWYVCYREIMRSRFNS